MKRHSTAALIKSGVIEELKKRVFIDKGVKYIFNCWYYDKGRLLFLFCREEDKNAFNPKCRGLSLYYQHFDNYKNTLSMILKCFDEVQEI